MGAVALPIATGHDLRDGTIGALLPASDYYYVITVFPGAAPSREPLP